MNYLELISKTDFITKNNEILNSTKMLMLKLNMASKVQIHCTVHPNVMQDRYKHLPNAYISMQNLSIWNWKVPTRVGLSKLL